MATVINVKLVNPANSEVLYNSMTLAKSYEEAINLAMHSWSGGVGVIKSTERIEDAVRMHAGCNSCWRYIYRCTVEDEEYDRDMVAVLFSVYQLKEEQHA